jgi:hypothetical protein
MKLENHTHFDAKAIPFRGIQGYLLTVIVKATFDFKSQPAAEQIPIVFGDLFEDASDGGGIRYESDLVPFKPRTDIVLSGQAYAPEGRPVQAMMVGLKVGAVESRLAVIGERFWNYTSLLSRGYTATRPKSFIRQPIRYAEAFGGVDASTGDYCVENTSGKGFFSMDTKAKIAGTPLPCIENPRHLIKTCKDHPLPVGYGFYHRSWFPRAKFAGTYDKAWRKKRSPWLPADFNYRFYNGAHPELQVKGYLKGNEPVELLHLTPEGVSQFNLPGINPQCNVIWWQKKNKDNGVPMNLDTLFLMPDEYAYCLVWRTAIPVKKVSAADIEKVTLDI